MRGNQEHGERTLITWSKSSNMFNNDFERFFRQMNQELISPQRDCDSHAWESSSMGLRSPQNMEFMLVGSPPFRSPLESPQRSMQLPDKDHIIKQLINLLPVLPTNINFAASQRPSLLDATASNHSHTFEMINPTKKLKSLFEFNGSSFEPLSDLLVQPVIAKASDSHKDQTLSSLGYTADTIPEPNQANYMSPFTVSLVEFSELGNRLEKLKSLYNILLKVFSHQTIAVDEYLLLSFLEKELLNSILHRKFLKKLTAKDMQLPVDSQVSTLNQIIQTTSSKRSEECYKFTLTRGIKHFKKHLRTEGESLSSVETLFYEHYFGRTADQLGLPIREFHYPLTCKRSSSKLNAKYFDLIFKSDLFIRNLLSYLDSQLIPEYTKQIAKKLAKLLSRWEKHFTTADSSATLSENSIKEYVSKNKRCKLPWTIFEVEESVERFHALVKIFSAKKAT